MAEIVTVLTHMKPYIICHMMASVDDGIDNPHRPATLLKLQSVERMGDTVWMRYKL